MPPPTATTALRQAVGFLPQQVMMAVRFSCVIIIACARRDHRAREFGRTVVNFPTPGTMETQGATEDPTHQQPVRGGFDSSLAHGHTPRAKQAIPPLVAARRNFVALFYLLPAAAPSHHHPSCSAAPRLRQ